MWLTLRQQRKRKLITWSFRVIAFCAAASLTALAFLAPPPAPTPAHGPSSLASLQLAAPAVSPFSTSANQAAELSHLIDLARRGFGLSAVEPRAAADAAIEWVMRETPLGGADFSPLKAAAALYQKGDVVGGDAIAARIGDPLQRLGLEWVALRAAPRETGLARLTAFVAAHPNWPSGGFLVSYREALLYSDRTHPETIRAAFADAAPTTPAGVLAVATVEQTAGHTAKAAVLIRKLWREENLDGWLEGAVLHDFKPLLTAADHRARAERLLYDERYLAALRAAALAGPDAVLLAQSWIAAAHGALPPKAFDALPAAVRNAPGLLYARIQGLRRADRILEASILMRSAPTDPTKLVAADRWWDERRMIARKLLDGGLSKDAYRLCAAQAGGSIPTRVDAAFHAGWIALRFLGDAKKAIQHFADIASIAQSPLAMARGAYWQGRAAEQAQLMDEAKAFYERAASYPVAYYGQLSAERLERPPMLHTPALAARARDRDDATQVAELLYDAKLAPFARALAIDAARSYTDETQLAAMAAVVARVGDASASVEMGKQAMLRGYSLDEASFPTFGVPQFEPLVGSADLPLVYSVARQESEFASAAASGVGAKGLMQLMPATARDTAKRAGVPFDPAKLITDPSFNTQLGAAFLGQLLSDEGGSAILALAAYNAGGGRVQQWIEAYGDPRLPNVDPVDWVERIPFDETRDYVQRVMENWGVYRLRFGDAARNAAGRLARD
jgi:soluble lytic murein transglycosylase